MVNLAGGIGNEKLYDNSVSYEKYSAEKCFKRMMILFELIKETPVLAFTDFGKLAYGFRGMLNEWEEYSPSIKINDEDGEIYMSCSGGASGRLIKEELTAGVCQTIFNQLLTDGYLVSIKIG